MFSRRSILAAGAAAPLLASCNWGSQGQKTISIGMVTFPGYAPLYLAEKLGLFEDVKVNLLRIESIGDLRSALLSGRLDVYLATFDIFQAIEGRAPIGKMIYAIDESTGADGIVVDGNINDISEIEGQRVGVEAGFPPHFVLTYELYKAGLRLSDINVIDMPSGDVPSAFSSGSIDVAATYEPFLSNCLAVKEGSKVLTSSADTPGLITDFMVASEKAMDEKPDALKQVIAGWEAALAEIQANPDSSNKVMGDAFGVPAEEMAEFASVVKWLGAEENAALINGDENSIAYQRFTEVNEALRLNNPRIYEAEPNSFIDTRFLDE